MPLKTAAVALAAAALTGCATTFDRGYEAYQAGQNTRAMDLFVACAQEGDAACMHNLGVMYQSRRLPSSDPRASAIGWYSLAARHGFQQSRAALVNLGAPVPAPDLVREPTQAELDAASNLGQAIGTLGGAAAGAAIRRKY